MTRTFGADNDDRFWIDKPIKEGHPKFKRKTKWYHIHIYNNFSYIKHISVDGFIEEYIKCCIWKCRCGKIKGEKS